MLYNRSNLPLTTTRHVHVSLWTCLKHSSGLTHIGSYRSSQRVKHPCGLSFIPDIFFFSEDVGTRCKANCYPRKNDCHWRRHGQIFFSPAFLRCNGPRPHLPQPDPWYACRTRVCRRHYNGGRHHCWYAMAFRCLEYMHPP